MVTMLLIGLTLVVYIAIGAGIAALIALYNGKKPGKYFRNNNTWLFVLMGATAITSVIALFNFGPALLLPESFPTPEQRGGLKDFLSHLLHGKNAPAESIPTEPLPWATGTWFWWKASLFYWLLTPAYACFALSDEVAEFCNSVKNLIKEKMKLKEKEGKPSGEHGHGSGHSSHAGPTGHSLGELVKADIIAEIISEFIKAFVKRK